MAKKASTPKAAQSQSTEAPKGTRIVKMIRVHTGYRGKKTRERYIEPGFYVVTDDRLFGLAQFLVDTGRAELLPTAAEVDVEDSVDDGGEAPEEGGDSNPAPFPVDKNGDPVDPDTGKPIRASTQL